MRHNAQALLCCLLLPLASCEPRATLVEPEGMTVLNALLYEPSLSGSAYRIETVTETSLTLVNNHGTVTAPWDADTRFRSANLNLIPTDPIHPCYTAIANYNSVGLGDGSFSLSSLAECGSNARVIIQFDNGLPPNPVRILSFQPIP